jgi:glutamate-1-semialdehyde 2,1-aminomutase
MSRAATGRSLVLKFHGHYHGWAGALGVGATFDVAPGIAPPPEAPNFGGASPDVAARTLVLDWNDAAAVREVFAAHGNERAAVFCEPYLHSYTNAPPAPGFLELLRTLTRRHGAILVFDEVKTGFRVHLGGYQAIAGVVPDLTALGKALGNGWTIAALAGRTDLMDLLGTTSLSTAPTTPTRTRSPPPGGPSRCSRTALSRTSTGSGHAYGRGSPGRSSTPESPRPSPASGPAGSSTGGPSRP